VYIQKKEFREMYYHGTYLDIEIGCGIFPNPKGYTHAKAVKELEDIFEEEKPSNIEFSRRNCIFLCDCEQDIDNAGGNTDIVYLVDIEDGFVESSDMSWYTKSSLQLSEGDVDGARESARKYWSGDALEGVYEYRTDEAYVVDTV
jgi:hypothetical protein